MVKYLPSMCWVQLSAPLTTIINLTIYGTTERHIRHGIHWKCIVKYVYSNSESFGKKPYILKVLNN